MSIEDRLLLEALITIAVPIYFTGVGIALVVITIFHGEE